jgi:cysteine-rich repeat protein
MNEARDMVRRGGAASALLSSFLLLSCGEHRLVVAFGAPDEVSPGGQAGEKSGAGSGGTSFGDGGKPPVAGSGGSSDAGVGNAAGSAGSVAGSGGMLVADGCGNGALDGDEQCDDGNRVSDDGCDSDCRFEAGFDCSGAPDVPCNRSCAGMTSSECAGGSCCSSPLVEGGTFEQWGTLSEESYESTVSSFRLDKYEVTVARFRQFMAARPAWNAAGNPKLGAGANPHIQGSGWSGWGDFAFGHDYPPICTDASAAQTTWAETGNDTLPLNCVTWYLAFEFCVWDGGRLPTKAEWEFAAAGGALQRRYPWGNEPTLTEQQDGTAAYAVYGSLGDGSAPDESSFEDILAVGSRPLGGGAFGHEDLAGSVSEWVYDERPLMDPTMPVTDFAVVSPNGITSRILGGGWKSPARELEVAYDLTTQRSAQWVDLGIRCARRP